MLVCKIHLAVRCGKSTYMIWKKPPSTLDGRYYSKMSTDSGSWHNCRTRRKGEEQSFLCVVALVDVLNHKPECLQFKKKKKGTPTS